MTKDKKNFFYSYSILSGTIIGVGLFSLPYLIITSSLYLLLLYFIFIGAIAISIHYLFGQISLATPDFKRMPGFAKLYFGKKGEIICLLTEGFGFIGALLAYLILGGKFLSSLPIPIIYQNDLLSTLIFSIFLSLLIYIGTNLIKKVEFIGVISLFIVFLVLAISGRHLFNINNIFLHKEKIDYFLPFGVLLFSLWGADIIPELEEVLKPKKYLLNKVIIYSILTAIIFYIIFSIMIVGITGLKTSNDGISSLTGILPQNVSYLVFIFALFAILTSYLSLGITFEKVLWYDLGIDRKISWIIIFFLPLLLFFIGARSFVKIISLIGAVGISLNGIIITLMYKKISPNKRINYLLFLLIGIFILAIGYEIIYLVK